MVSFPLFYYPVYYPSYYPEKAALVRLERTSNVSSRPDGYSSIELQATYRLPKPLFMVTFKYPKMSQIRPWTWGEREARW